MNKSHDERVGPMLNPPRPGELIRESMEEMGSNVTETAARMRLLGLAHRDHAREKPCRKSRGRAVSRTEAIRIASGILTRAERERLALAENEARRGIQWNDE